MDPRFHLAGASASPDALALRKKERLDGVRGARMGLLLIDLQNDFCHPDGVFARAAGAGYEDVEPVVDRVNALAAVARRWGHLVVWARMAWAPGEGPGLLAAHSPLVEGDVLREGSWGAELLGSLDRRDGDRIVRKSRFSAFYRTELERVLVSEGITTLVVGGVRTDFCVESTVRDAFFRDLEVFVVVDAVLGYARELHEHSLRMMNTLFAQVVDQDDAIGLLASRGAAAAAPAGGGADGHG